MPTSTFPLAAQTEIQLSTDFNVYKVNFVPGEKTFYKIRDYIPPVVSEFNAKFYTDDLKSVETYLKNLKGYLPFYFMGDLYICKGYSLTFSDDNKGNIDLSLSKYSNQAP